MGDCLSHFLLSRFKSDDMSKDEADRIHSHLAACDRCRALSLQMDEHMLEFSQNEESRRAALMARIDEETISLSKRRIGRFAVAIGALTAAAAAAVLVVAMVSSNPPDNSAKSDIAFKGALSVEITANRNGDQFLVRDGATLIPGDALRFIVTTDRPGFLTVFSEDATGRLSSFYPDSEPGDDPTPLAIDSAGRRELSGSIILDNAVGKERFIIVFSPHAFNRADVQKRGIAALDGADNYAVGKEFLVESITVLKESQPGR